MKPTVIPVLALLAAGVANTRAADLLRVSAVTCVSQGEVTRVSVEVSGPFDFHADRAHGPERLFFDIFSSQPHIGGRRIHSDEVDGKLVERIRVAETQPGITRIVLDLGSNQADYTAKQLSNPDRLVIELRAASTAAPPILRPPVVNQVSAPAAVPDVVHEVADPVPASPPSGPLVDIPAVAERPAALPLSPAPGRDTGRAARLTSDGASSLTRALGLKIRRVVLDPGHGGHDQGTVGPTGLTEKDLVLDVALRLGKLIESRLGSEVIFTRSDDTFIPLEGRTALANEKKADLFLSIHANSSPYPRIGGVESYFLNFTDSKESLAVAARENAASDKSVFELHDMIQKITLQDKAEESKEFAGDIQTSLFAFAARYNGNIKNRGIKKAPFVVLIGASMPSVLAEIGFLSNPRDEALLKKAEHRQRLAEALYKGVSRYAQSLSHFQMAEARGQTAN